jgi:integral membrane protein
MPDSQRPPAFFWPPSLIGRFRTIAFWEGISFLVLLFIAMPMKYGLGMPLAVRVVGMAHGLLFIAYVIALGLAATNHGWGPKWVAVAFGASLVPGGTFWLDGRLRELEAAPPAA